MFFFMGSICFRFVKNFSPFKKFFSRVKNLTSWQKKILSQPDAEETIITNNSYLFSKQILHLYKYSQDINIIIVV